jgi:hypothetical protein
MTPPAGFILHLVPVPDRRGREPIIRLRRLLKLALRDCALRCTRAVEADGPGPGSAPGPGSGPARHEDVHVGRGITPDHALIDHRPGPDDLLVLDRAEGIIVDRVPGPAPVREHGP